MLMEYSTQKQELNKLETQEPSPNDEDKPDKVQMTLLSHLSDLEEMPGIHLNRAGFLKYLVIKYFDKDTRHEAHLDYTEYMKLKNKNNGKTEN